MPEQQIHTETVPQRPDLNVETIVPDRDVIVTSEQLPWVTTENLNVPTVLVRSTEGLSFRYGSTIGANSSVEKLAADVPDEQSLSAERTMFKSLPFLFEGKLPPNIDRDAPTEAAWPIFKVAKKGKDASRLFFTWFSDEQGQPVVLKLAIASHKKQDELLGVLRHTAVRRHKDGHSR